VEQGASPFNMKEGFQKSAKKHMTASGGWYLSIPFRFAAATSLGESSVFSGKLPPEVYHEVKKNNIINKSNILNIPTALTQPTVRKTVTIKRATFEQYTAKSSIFLGLQKTTKTYESASQNTYTSFRRVSDKSDNEAFIHPGITARNLSIKAVEDANLPQLIPQLTDTFLQGIF